MADVVNVIVVGVVELLGDKRGETRSKGKISHLYLYHILLYLD
jgi:hypothetical protein